MKTLKTPINERKWLGEEDFGWCPVCHSNALIKGEERWDGLKHDYECQVCSSGGTLETDGNGGFKFVIAENGLDRNRFLGTEEHLTEIGAGMEFFYARENQKIVHEQIEKYKAMEFPSL